MSHPTDLERSILRTLVWFSLFDYPLTAFEIWKWLYAPARAYHVGEVYVTLSESEWLRARVTSLGGFFSPVSEDRLRRFIATRHERFLDALRKFAKLKRSSEFLGRLPGIQGVAAVNTLAWWNTRPESDIDLLIIVSPNTIWTSRFFAVLPYVLTRQRPVRLGQTSSVSTKPDPLCFSFFLSEERLSLRAICLPRDPYMAYWVRSLVPIFDRRGVFGEMHKQNAWAAEMLPHAQPRNMHRHLKGRKVTPVFLSVSWFESVFRWVQWKRLPASLKDMANKDTRVVLNDHVLKFHETDRRDLFRRAFERRSREAEALVYAE